MKKWVGVVALGAAYFAAGWSLHGVTGLTRTLVANSADRPTLDTRRVDAIDLAHLEADTRAKGITATWQGVWEVPARGLYELALASRGRSTWTIDGVLALEASSDAETRRTVWLDAAFHQLVIVCDVDPAAPLLTVAAAPYGRPPQALTSATLKPRPPRHPMLRAATAALHTILGWLTLVALVFAIRATTTTLVERWHLQLPGWAKRRARVAAWLALACIAGHGALLRIDAITGRYGVVASPRWLAAMQTRSFAPPAAIRPAGIVWDAEPLFPHKDGIATHYRSDPYIYLDAARHMTSFYTAHFREPFFPFATKLSLWILGGQDVAVSFASAFFSTLAIVFTYLLGAALWSRAAGLIAALALSLDVDVVSRSALGWRDDAYVAMVAFCAYLLVRWWQTETANDRGILASAIGVAVGLAILTRFMALSFAIAGIAWMVLGHGRAWRRYLRPAGLAAGAAILVSAPYFINCWRAFGDPFATFNIHGGIYSVTEHQGGFEGSTASYMTGKIARRPFEMIDTVAQGVTTYPFMNKWHGLNQWWPGTDMWAMTAALAGLVLLAASARGRLLLLLLGSSLVPFSFTWTVDPDYRFTEFAYPLFLVAMAVAVVAAARVVRALFIPAWTSAARPWRDPGWRSWAAVVGSGLAVLWVIHRFTPIWVEGESLGLHDEVTIASGARDDAFFRDGWSSNMPAGNLNFRVARDEGLLVFRVPMPDDYSATLRMDPFPRPLMDPPGRSTEVELLLNGAPLTTMTLKTTPGRVGAYDIVLPRAAVRAGVNRLVVRIKRPAAVPAAQIRPGLSEGDAVAVWYLRVRPPTAG